MSDAAGIIAYLRARYDELEFAAKCASVSAGLSGEWTLRPGLSTTVADGDGLTVVYNEGSPTQYTAAHIAANDPASVLADIESKRRILDYCDMALTLAAADGRPHSVPARNAEVLSIVVEMLAQPFRDRPDFPEGWRQG